MRNREFLVELKALLTKHSLELVSGGYEEGDKILDRGSGMETPLREALEALEDEPDRLRADAAIHEATLYRNNLSSETHAQQIELRRAEEHFTAKNYREAQWHALHSLFFSVGPRHESFIKVKNSLLAEVTS